jgi:hypothetical protein
MESINEDRLFKKLPYFFDKPSNVFIELAQNASRADATILDIGLRDNVLTAWDNGEGCNNPEAIFILAESDWASAVESVQNPAGWGLFFLLCISTEVTFQSNFGTVTVDCRKYLESASYRKNILDNINPGEKTEGFYLRAILKKEIAKNIMQNVNSSLRYFPLDITVNGRALRKENLRDNACGSRDHVRDHIIETTYEGNDVYIVVGSHFPESPQSLKSKMTVVWYGIPIECSTYYTCVYVDVREGSILTPVLPYRTAIKEDEKLEAFYGFVRDKVAAYCIDYLNDPEKTDEFRVLNIMEAMECIATQGEMDMLRRFYVRVDEPHYPVESWNSNCKSKRIVHMNEASLKNEIVSSVTVKCLEDSNGQITDKVYKDTESLVLPEGTIEAISLPRKHPSWLKVIDRELSLEVVCDGQPARENYTWTKAGRITCGDKKIDVLALVGGWSDAEIFYTKNPGDVYDITTPIFDRFLYCDDFECDTYDTQREYFDKEIERDLMHVTGSYSKYDLLKGLDLAGLDISKITSIRISKDKMLISLGKKGSKTLKLAA